MKSNFYNQYIHLTGAGKLHLLMALFYGMFTQEVIMQEVMGWIDKEVKRLDMVIEGKGVNTAPESVPGALRAALYACS